MQDSDDLEKEKVKIFPGQSATHAQGNLTPEDNDVATALTPGTHGVNPGESRTNFLKRTQDAVRPTFDGDTTGSQEQYLQQAHEIKQQASLNLARSGAGTRQDQDKLFDEIARNNPNYTNPNHTAMLLELYQQELRKSPEALLRSQDEEQRERDIQERGLSPVVESARDTFSEEGKPAFDAARDREMLNRLFPPPPEDSDRDERGYKRGSYASQNPIKKSPQEEFVNKRNEINEEIAKMSRLGDREGASEAAKVMQIIQNRIDAGTMDGESAMLAMDNLEGAGRSTVTKRRRPLATALGIEEETDEGRNRVGAEQLEIAEARSRAELNAKNTADARQPNDPAQEGLVTFKDSSGNEVQMIRQANGTLKAVPGKKLAPGAYQNPDGMTIASVGLDGKSTTYPTQSHWLGDDGIIRKRDPIYKVYEDDSREIIGYKPARVPRGVKNMTDGQTPSRQAIDPRPGISQMASPAGQAPLPEVPQAGFERNGFRFKGGDPALKQNWEEI